MINVTENEFKVLRAIDESEYGDVLVDAVWSWSITDHTDLPARSIGGIVSSLRKKGLVYCGDVGTEDAATGMTEAGAERYAHICAARNLRREKARNYDEQPAFLAQARALHSAEKIDEMAQAYLVMAGC